MSSNLRDVKVGDWIWTIKKGWTQVTYVEKESVYPIGTNYLTFTVNGLSFETDAHPSAFTEPPECFNAKPKPCEGEMEEYSKEEALVMMIEEGHKMQSVELEPSAYLRYDASLGVFMNQNGVVMSPNSYKAKKWFIFKDIGYKYLVELYNGTQFLTKCYYRDDDELLANIDNVKYYKKTAFKKAL
jgi:hypothetical protein